MPGRSKSLFESFFVAPTKNGITLLEACFKICRMRESMAWSGTTVRSPEKILTKKISITFRLLVSFWLQKDGLSQAQLADSGTAYALGPMHRDARF